MPNGDTPLSPANTPPSIPAGSAFAKLAEKVNTPQPQIQSSPAEATPVTPAIPQPVPTTVPTPVPVSIPAVTVPPIAPLEPTPINPIPQVPAKPVPVPLPPQPVTLNVAPPTVAPAPPVAAPTTTPALIPRPETTSPQLPIKIELNISTAQPTGTPTSSSAQTPVTASPTQKAQEGVVVQTGNPNQKAAAPIATQSAAKPTKPDSLIKRVMHWTVFLSLVGLGAKGFFDSLYFIAVEFQHFENGLEKNYVEPTLISNLMLKALLLVFSTALCAFFALQLSLLNKRGNKWLTIFASMAVFVVSYFLLQHANTINVVDVFKQ